MEAEKAFRQRMQEKYLRQHSTKQGKVMALLAKGEPLRPLQIAKAIGDISKNVHRVLRPLLEAGEIQRLFKSRREVYYTLSDLPYNEKEFSLTPRSQAEKQLLDIINQRTWISRQELIKRSGFRESYLDKQINRLIAAGLIVKKQKKREGRDGWTVYYQCASLDAKFAKFTAEFVRFMLTLLDFESLLGRFWQHGY